MASVRRVRRIVRKIDPWTVLKVSFVFYAVMALGLVLGLIIFWAFVNQAGYPDTVESLLADLGLWDAGESPTVPEGDYLFRAVAFLGVAWAVMMTGLTTLSAVMYNLISDMVGGLEFVVLEETTTMPAVAPAGALPVRQVQSWQTTPPAAKATPEPASESAAQPSEETSISSPR